jgi:hypothetical protein
MWEMFSEVFFAVQNRNRFRSLSNPSVIALRRSLEDEEEKRMATSVPGTRFEWATTAAKIDSTRKFSCYIHILFGTAMKQQSKKKIVNFEISFNFPLFRSN